MEEQIVTIKVVTTGEICEMSNDEIIGQIIVQIRVVFSIHFMLLYSDKADLPHPQNRINSIYLEFCMWL